MPTSFPRAFPEVRFPAEFEALYNKPKQYFDSGMKYDHGVGIGPTFEGITDNTQYHIQKQAEARAQVENAMKTNAVRRLNQITGKAQRAYENSVVARTALLQGSGMPGNSSPPFGAGTIEGAPVLAGRGLAGGVMRTQAGQQFLKQALKKREEDFNRIDLARLNLLQENPQEPVASLSADDEQVEQLGNLIDGIQDSIGSGNLDDGVAMADRLLKTLLSIGWKLTQQNITGMLRDVATIRQELYEYVRGVPAGANPGEQRRIRAMGLKMERVGILLRELTSASTLSPNDRKLRLSALKPRLRKVTQAQLQASQEARFPARQAPGAVVGYPGILNINPPGAPPRLRRIPRGQVFAGPAPFAPGAPFLQPGARLVPGLGRQAPYIANPEARERIAPEYYG